MNDNQSSRNPFPRPKDQQESTFSIGSQSHDPFQGQREDVMDHRVGRSLGTVVGASEQAGQASTAQPQDAANVPDTHVYKGVKANFKLDVNMPCPKTQRAAFAQWMRTLCNRLAADNDRVISPAAKYLLTLEPERGIDRFKLRNNAPTLNLTKRENIEAILMTMIGRTEPNECSPCLNRAGPFSRCRVVKGFADGCCGNCRYNDKQTRCTFRVETRTEGEHEHGNSGPVPQVQRLPPQPVSSSDKNRAVPMSAEMSRAKSTQSISTKSKHSINSARAAGSASAAVTPSAAEGQELDDEANSMSGGSRSSSESEYEDPPISKIMTLSGIRPDGKTAVKTRNFLANIVNRMDAEIKRNLAQE